MNMNMKICIENKEKIEAALLAVNGRASVHCYTSYSDVEALIVPFVTRLERLGLTSKKLRVGAELLSVSGGSVAKSYNRGFSQAINATSLRVRVCSSGFYLMSVTRECICPKGGDDQIILNKEQDIVAHRFLASNFEVMGMPCVKRLEMAENTLAVEAAVRSVRSVRPE